MHLGYISLVSFSIHQKINWPILCALSLACIKLRIWVFERLENLSESARDGLFPFLFGLNPTAMIRHHWETFVCNNKVCLLLLLFLRGGCRHDMVIQANVHDDINVTLVVLAIRRPSSNALLLTTCFWLLLLTRPSRPFWGRPFLKFPSNWCAAAGINNDWATVKVGLSGGGCDCIYISKINASFEIALGNDGPTVDAVTLNCCNGSFCCFGFFVRLSVLGQPDLPRHSSVIKRDRRVRHASHSPAKRSSVATLLRLSWYQLQSSQAVMMIGGGGRRKKICVWCTYTSRLTATARLDSLSLPRYCNTSRDFTSAFISPLGLKHLI